MRVKINDDGPFLPKLKAFNKSSTCKNVVDLRGSMDDFRKMDKTITYLFNN